MSRHSVILPTICFNNKTFATVLQNKEVLAAEETSGFTFMFTLDSEIGHYLVISDKTEK